MRSSSAIPPDAAARGPQGMARDPARPRSVEEWARFGVLRARCLWHLRRDLRLWVLQGRNVLGGLTRYATCLGLFLVLVPPVLAFWEGVLWAPAATPPRGPEVVSTWVGRGVLWLVGLIVGDIFLLGKRLSRFRNVFVEEAERMAWAVVDAEPPAAAGTTQRRPGAPEHDTQSAP